MEVREAQDSCRTSVLTVKDCGNKLVGECKTDEDRLAVKDRQYKRVLEQVLASVQGWDSAKCPAVK